MIIMEGRIILGPSRQWFRPCIEDVGRRVEVVNEVGPSSVLKLKGHIIFVGRRIQ